MYRKRKRKEFGKNDRTTPSALQAPVGTSMYRNRTGPDSLMMGIPPLPVTYAVRIKCTTHHQKKSVSKIIINAINT